MRFRTHRLLTLAILATYGSIALLGQGLHGLAADDGHHHGFEVVQCAVPSGPHGHHHHDHHSGGHDHGHFHDRTADSECQHGENCGHAHAGHPADVADIEQADGLLLTSSDCTFHTHDCQICVHLSQARGERVAAVQIVLWRPLVAVVGESPRESYLPASLGPQAPRGPPQLI